MLRCAELGLRGDDLEEMSIGMVFDMLTEKANDSVKYDTKGKAGTLKQFLMGGGK